MQLEAKTADGDIRLVVNIEAIDAIAVTAGYRLYDVTTNPNGDEIAPDSPGGSSFTITQHPAMMSLMLAVMPVFANATAANVFIAATQNGAHLAHSDTGNPGPRHLLWTIHKGADDVSGTIYTRGFFIHST